MMAVAILWLLGMGLTYELYDRWWPHGACPPDRWGFIQLAVTWPLVLFTLLAWKRRTRT